MQSGTAINLSKNDTERYWTSQHIQACQDWSGILFDTKSEAIEKASHDFGRLTQGEAVAVVYPKDSHDLVALLDYANKHQLKYTLRSGGYSQGGQTLPPAGVVTIDCSQMTQIGALDLQNLTLKCQSGVTWGAIIEATAPHGLAPKVMPFFPDLTVGGILSIGGISGNSHKYGCVSGNVEELEVVTGLGERKICSPSAESPLFEAILCGLGRCGAITSATLGLRKVKPKVKTFYLRYANHADWIADQEKLIELKSCDYLEAFCSPVPSGLCPDSNGWKPLIYWTYALQVSFEFEGDEPAEDVIKALKHQQLIHQGVSETLNFLTRYGTRAKNMKASGNWQFAHPWWECFFTGDVMTKILPELLEKLPLTLGDGLGYRVFSMNNNVPQSFMKASLGFAALPLGVDPNSIQSVTTKLKEVNEWALSNGGKRYISGWLGSMTSADWIRHYGPYYDTWVALKEKYDPNNVFDSVLFRGEL